MDLIHQLFILYEFFMNTDFPTPTNPETSAGKHPVAGSIQDVLTFKLNRLVMINEREGHRWSEDSFGLSLNEWRVLAVVQAKSPMRVGDVSALLLMDKSQLSRLIKRLQVKLLIKSKPDTHDARAIVLAPTSKGAALYHAMFAEVMRQNEQVLAPLSAEEVSQLDDMLNRLTAHNVLMLQEPICPLHQSDS